MWSKDEISIIFFSKKIVIKQCNRFNSKYTKQTPIERWNPNSISSWEAADRRMQNLQKNKWIMILKQNTQHNALLSLPLILSSWLLNGSKQTKQKHRHTHTTHRKTKTCVVKIVVIIQKTTKTLCIDEIKTLTLNEPLMKKEREKWNKFQQKKTFQHLRFVCKTRERNSPAFTRKSHPSIEIHNFTHSRKAKKQNSKFVRY